VSVVTLFGDGVELVKKQDTRELIDEIEQGSKILSRVPEERGHKGI